jgi:exopolysaccharide biosynthesis polyprenyl glycosylphosphotransferase
MSYRRKNNYQGASKPKEKEGDFDQRAPHVNVSFSRGMSAGWLRALIFVMLDSFLISVSWFLAQFIVNSVSWLNSVKSFDLITKNPQQPGFIWPILAITLTTIATTGLYGERHSRRRFLNLVKSLTLAQCLLLVIAFLYQPGVFISRSSFLLAWFFSLIFVSTGRLIAEGIITLIRHQGRISRKIFLVGSPADTLIAKISLKLFSNKEFNIVGQVDLSAKENSECWPEILEQLCDLDVGEVFVCSWHSIPDRMDFYWSLKTAGIHMRVLPVGLNIPNQVPKIEMIGGIPTIKFSPPMIIGSDYWLKRTFDLVLATLVLIFASPLFLLIAILIKLDSPGPIFYQQTRVGLRCHHFKLWKFRTMVINAEQLQKQLEAQNEIKGGVLFKIKDDPRVTKVGKFLRRSSLDELPQLFNVLMGQMSLVGPRPLALRDFQGLSEHHLVRHNVMPGITGLWQVSGRSNIIDFENAFRLDLMYINNWSLGLDFIILLKTIKVVLFPEGAY